MTGKDIQSAAFEKAGMRGYRADQVDAYLHTVSEYVDEQNEKIEDLTYKIKVLADKVEEYRADEENIREALLGAQKLGSSVVNEAKTKAQKLTEESQAAADEMLAQAKVKVEALTKESLQRATADLNALKREYETEQRNYDLLKKEISKFKSNIMQQYRSHIAMVMALPSVEEPKTESAEAAVSEPENVPEVEQEERIAAEPETAAVVSEEASAEQAQEMSAEPAVTDSEENTVPENIPENTEEESYDALQGDMGQTIEFKRAVLQETAPVKPERPNYMEKFGELRFGGFNGTDK